MRRAIACVETICFITMWDGRCNMEGIMSCEFYLNYVGCKVSFSTIYKRRLTGFYLNYVGCKAISFNFLISSKICFTLTMWDVKFNLVFFLNSEALVLP